jgi:hypothetical protein
MYKITERVEEEYGPADYGKIANVLEPFGIISTMSIVFIIIYVSFF